MINLIEVASYVNTQEPSERLEAAGIMEDLNLAEED